MVHDVTSGDPSVPPRGDGFDRPFRARSNVVSDRPSWFSPPTGEATSGDPSVPPRGDGFDRPFRARSNAVSDRPSLFSPPTATDQGLPGLVASTETVRGLSSSNNSEAAGSIGTGGSGVVVNDPAEVAHATQQMRRLSVSFRDTQQHAETIQREIAESGAGQPTPLEPNSYKPSSPKTGATPTPSTPRSRTSTTDHKDSQPPTNTPPNNSETQPSPRPTTLVMRPQLFGCLRSDRQ